MYQSDAGTLGYATGEQAARLAQQLRTEHPGKADMHFARIRFEEEHQVRGINAAMGAGVMIFDGASSTLEVPWTTLPVLNRMAIPCISISPRPPGGSVELLPPPRKNLREVKAMEIPTDVQEGIREIYGEDELLRQIAEVDQLDAKLRDDIEADIAEIERRRRAPTSNREPR